MAYLSRHVTAVLTLALTAALADTAVALHRQTDPLVQITALPSATLGGVRWLGSAQMLTFHSGADLVRNGNRTTQVFVFDLSDRAKQRLPGITQVTEGALPSLAAAIAKRGKIVAFQSQQDLLGNGTHGWQVFLDRPPRKRVGRGPRVQMTVGPGETTAPLINDGGKYIFFQSTLDLTGAGLPPGTYLYRSAMPRMGDAACPSYPCPGNPGLTLVAPAEARNPVIAASGERVVFESDGDVLGDGSANGYRQLYARDFATTANPGGVRQLTFGEGHSGNAAMTSNGSKVLFQSAANLLGRSNGRTQIFQLSLGTDPPGLTQRTSGKNGDSTDPAITRAGDRAAILSTADLAGLGASGAKEVFLLKLSNKLTGPALSQLTLTGRDQGRPIIQYSFVVFPSRSDVDGNPTTDPHLLLINTAGLVGGSAPD
jgi:hypothetical protein